jgi:hypothetical protein
MMRFARQFGPRRGQTAGWWGSAAAAVLIIGSLAWPHPAFAGGRGHKPPKVGTTLSCDVGLARIPCGPAGPTLTFSFWDTSIEDHDNTTLAIDLVRSDDSLADSGLGYQVTLPAGLTIDGTGTLACTGTLSTTQGGSTITVTGASINAGTAGCQVLVAVTSDASGTYTIDSSSVGSLTGDVDNGAGTETLTVVPAAPEVGAYFSPDEIDVLTTSSLHLSLERTDQSPTATATGLGYTVSLPSGLVVAPAGITSNDCGGTPSAPSGGTTITLSSGALTAGDLGCQLRVTVKANTSGDHAIDYPNITSVTGVVRSLSQGCLDSVPDDRVSARSPVCLPTLTADKLPQTVTFTQPGNVSSGSAGLFLSGSADSGLTVAYTSSTSSVCAVTGTLVTVQGAGTCTIVAAQPGNDIYQAATTVSRSFTVSGATAGSQTITFVAPGSVALSAGTTSLTGSATSGLPVTYTSGTPLVCTVSGSTVTLLTLGGCTITAAQAGNGSYAAASPVTQQFAVTRGGQTIAFAGPAATRLSAGTVSVTATATSGLPVEFATTTPPVCTVSGRTVTLIAAGSCTITAGQPGNDNYAAATTVSRTFAVTVPPPAPRSVTATAGVSSIVASWDAPADTTGITGYTATASPGPATCSTSGATTCVLGGTAGVTYTISVVANTGTGDSSATSPSNEATPTAPEPPAVVPDTDLDLTTDKGLITTAAPGQVVVFIGTGFAAHSTVTISIYSDPTVLGTVVTDGNGDFRKPITVPPDLAEGAHTAVAQGVAPDGTGRSMKLAITVAARTTTSAPPKSGTGGGKLPTTGLDIRTMLLAGLLSLATGTGLIFAARPRRRRPTARHAA